VIAIFPAPGRYPPNKGQSPESLERAVFSCDYNGWADVPEEEREGVDAFECAPVLLPRAVLPVPIPIRSSLTIQVSPERKAA
jgi:hypothetical protein